MCLCADRDRTGTTWWTQMRRREGEDLFYPVGPAVHRPDLTRDDKYAEKDQKNRKQKK